MVALQEEGKKERRSVVRLQVGQSDGAVNFGSGFVVSDRGRILIVTCYHVIADEETESVAKAIRIVWGNVTYEAYPEKILGKEDLAILALERSAPRDLFQRLKIGQTVSVAVGESVLGMGYPQTSEEIVIGKGKILHKEEDCIETNVFTQPGFSGSPLLNLEGEVIGVIAGYTRCDEGKGDGQGKSFAIPSEFIWRLLEPRRTIDSLLDRLRQLSFLIPFLWAALRVTFMVLGVLFLLASTIIWVANPFVDKRLIEIAPQFTLAYETSFEANASIEAEIFDSVQEPHCAPEPYCARVQLSHSVAKHGKDVGGGGWILVLWDKFFTNFLKNLRLDGILRKGRDFERYPTLSFKVKGETGGAIFGVGIKDTKGNEDRVLIAPEMSSVCWSGKVYVYQVPADSFGEIHLELDKYFPRVDFSSLENISFFVNGCAVPESAPGTRLQDVYITDIRFTRP
jgi:hypothetical protein